MAVQRERGGERFEMVLCDIIGCNSVYCAEEPCGLPGTLRNQALLAGWLFNATTDVCPDCVRRASGRQRKTDPPIPPCKYCNHLMFPFDASSWQCKNDGCIGYLRGVSVAGNYPIRPSEKDYSNYRSLTWGEFKAYVDARIAEQGGGNGLAIFTIDVRNERFDPDDLATIDVCVTVTDDYVEIT